MKFYSHEALLISSWLRCYDIVEKQTFVYLRIRTENPSDVFQLFKKNKKKTTNRNNILTSLFVHRSMSSTTKPHSAGRGQCPVQQAVLPRLHLGQSPAQRGRGTEGHGHPACRKCHPDSYNPACALWIRRLCQVSHTLRQGLCILRPGSV